MEDKEIYRELNKRILEIRTENYIELMKTKIIPFVEGYVQNRICDVANIDIFNTAHEMFCNLKKNGKIDELNQII